VHGRFTAGKIHLSDAFTPGITEISGNIFDRPVRRVQIIPVIAEDAPNIAF
jgi:hypothetical protein